MANANAGNWLVAIASGLTLAAMGTPAAAGSLQFWEDGAGAPGVAASFASGVGLEAAIVYDADTAEGGGLLQGATEIEIRPLGSVQFVAFDCAFNGCHEGTDYRFDPGGEGEGGLVLVSDPSFKEKHGIDDVGAIAFDAEQYEGSIELILCNYTGLDFIERTCSPTQLVVVPEPDAGVALLAGLALLLHLHGRRAAQR